MDHDSIILNESVARAEATAKHVASQNRGGSNIIGNILLTLIILTIIGVMAYGIYDYIATKKSLNSQIGLNASNNDFNSSNISNEALTRSSYNTSNNLMLNNLVTDINSVNVEIVKTTASTNSQMKNAMTTLQSDNYDNKTDITDLKGRINYLQDNDDANSYQIGNFNGGFNQLGQIMSVNGAVSTDFLGDLTQQNPNADFTLLKHVMMVNGLSASDLTPNRSVQLCGPNGANGGSNCIQIPDENGNIQLNPFDSTKKILLNGGVVTAPKASVVPAAYAQSQLYVNGPAVFNAPGLVAGQDTLGLMTTIDGNVGIGTSSPSGCKVQINPGTGAGLKVMDASGNMVLQVDSNVTIGSRLYFGSGSNYIGTDGQNMVINGPLKIQDITGAKSFIVEAPIQAANPTQSITIYVADTSYDGINVRQYNPCFCINVSDPQRDTFNTAISTCKSFSVDNQPLLVFVKCIKGAWPTNNPIKDVYTYGPSAQKFTAYTTHTFVFTY